MARPPSWGFLFTEISIPDITLIRDVMEAMVHESHDGRGCGGRLQYPGVLRIGIEHGQVVDERCQLPLVCRADSLGYGGRGGHDGLDVAPAAETELFQGLLVQRVGNGQPEGSVGG